jgi:hypothetical protein
MSSKSQAGKTVTTAESHTKTAYVRSDGALVPIGEVVMTDGGQTLADAEPERPAVDEPETCDGCGLPLSDAHDQPAGYVRESTDGRTVCGACNDIERDLYRQDGRVTADELEAEESR